MDTGEVHGPLPLRSNGADPADVIAVTGFRSPRRRRL